MKQAERRPADVSTRLKHNVRRRNKSIGSITAKVPGHSTLRMAGMSWRDALGTGVLQETAKRTVKDGLSRSVLPYITSQKTVFWKTCGGSCFNGSEEAGARQAQTRLQRAVAHMLTACRHDSADRPSIPVSTQYYFLAVSYIYATSRIFSIHTAAAQIVGFTVGRPTVNADTRNRC